MKTCDSTMKPGKARPEQDAKDSFNPYGSIEAWRGVLADPHLSPGAKLAYNDLTYRNRSGHAFPSMKTLAGAKPRDKSPPLGGLAILQAVT